MKTLKLVGVMAMAALLLSGCEGDSSDGSEATLGMAGNAGGENTTPEGATDGAGTMSEDGAGDAAGTTNNEVPADCAFDPELEGKGPGRQIANFPLQVWNGDRFDFHQNCGGGTKAVWVFLSTGWCGACETYARTAQEFYSEFRDQGLEIVWIVGEDRDRNPPSREYMARYQMEKNADFTIIRDNDFNQTRRFIDPNAAGNILPRQYVIDASNMEMLYAGGRPFERGECEFKRLLGIEGAVDCESIE